MVRLIKLGLNNAILGPAVKQVLLLALAPVIPLFPQVPDSFWHSNCHWIWMLHANTPFDLEVLR